MRNCKQKKRVQIYLDGWLDESESAKFEKHLRKCSDCQSEIMELEELSSAALEIPDEAPDRNYWDSFYARTLNRIISRDVSPYERKAKARDNLKLKIGSYTFAIISLAFAMFLLINYVPYSPELPSPPAANLEQYNNANQNEPEIGIADQPEISQKVVPDDPEPKGIVVTERPEPVEDAGGPADSAPSPENVDNVEATRADNVEDIESYFRGGLLTEKAALSLSSDPFFLNRRALADYEQVSAEYRLNASMIAEGILPQIKSEDGLGRVAGREFSNNQFSRGLGGATNGYLRNWGYLSMPQDTANSGQIRRFLIELELTQSK